MSKPIPVITRCAGDHAHNGCGRIGSTLPVVAFGLLLSGCTNIWNASDLALWVRDQAVDQGCQRDTVELEEWYTETVEGNVWRGICQDLAGNARSFGINIDSVWTPSESAKLQRSARLPHTN